MDDLLPEFLTETTEALGDLDVALVKLERTPGDHATLSLIFRLVHTIKGTCGFLGLPRLEHVAHAAENVLGRVRDGELTATPDVISLVLSSLDQIKSIVAGLATSGAEPQGDDSKLIEALDRVAAGGAAAPAQPVLTAASSSPESAQSPAETASEATAPVSEPPPLENAVATQTIRVTVEVLEELMTLVGELVLTRNQLLQLSRAQGTTAFTAPLQRLSHITSDLQEGVMKTRMQPIGSAWNKLPRLVRDLAQETGKKIVLEMRGQETELDRQILELMRDPLTHMVRNSADHGLEPPEERRARGKPESGRIALNAYHEGGHILIEVSDDGRGLDVTRIKAKALAKGLASEAELALMSDAQIRAFIFRAGFSTAEAVTAISGRGVGMDVVRSNIEQIGGTIELASTLGQGSCFTIKIPLTLAIVSALIVQASGEKFAIPQINVRELVRVGDGLSDISAKTSGGMAVEHIGPSPVLRLRDQLLPLVSLGSLLRIESDTPGESIAGVTPTGSRASTIVVTSAGSLQLGILVDEVFDTEEIVVKPVAPILRHITMFSGNTILGDGSVIMILDPNGVARSAGVTSRGPAGTQQQASETCRTRSEEKLALLLFRAGADGSAFAVPLNLVARLERIPRARIERSGNGYVTQYRGKLMPLIAMHDELTLRLSGETENTGELSQAVLVFADGQLSMGLMVDEIIDVIHDHLRIELGATRAGILGTAVIGGKAAEVLDTAHWLTLAWRDWFGTGRSASSNKPRILVVEDSNFFRQLLIPTLSAAGYDVSAAGGTAEALRLRDSGLMVDAIISDIDMPELDGLDFARAVREGGAWSELPMIALTGRSNASDVENGRSAGFTDYVQKSQREALIQSLRQCLADHALVR